MLGYFPTTARRKALHAGADPPSYLSRLEALPLHHQAMLLRMLDLLLDAQHECHSPPPEILASSPTQAAS